MPPKMTTYGVKGHLGGQEDLASLLIPPIIHTVAPVIPMMNLLAKSRDPPSKCQV